MLVAGRSTVLPPGRSTLAAAVLIAVVAIVLAVVVLRRDGCDCGGPLSSEPTDIEEVPGSALGFVTVAGPGGSTETLTLHVFNTAATPAQVTGLRIRGGLAVALLGQFDREATGPPLTVVPEDGFQLSIRLDVPADAALGSVLAFDGVTVEYEVGGRRYADDLPILAAAICVGSGTCDRDDPEVAAAQASALRQAGG